MKNLIISAMLVFVFAVMGATAPAVMADSARDDGEARVLSWGNDSFPGNSLFGRSHNMRNMHRHMWRWQGAYYADWDEYIDGVRDWIRSRLQDRVQEFDRDSSEVDVVTRSATEVDDDRALLRGEVDLHDSEYADVWFVYGEYWNDLDETTDSVRIKEDDDTEFDEVVSGLDHDTRYYFRAVGEDENGDKDYGQLRYFVTDDDGSPDEPDALTYSAINIDSDEATLRGEVDMNDFEDGIVFFVYGEDEDAVEDVADEYDTYSDIDEDGLDLQKVLVDSDLDGSDSYQEDITGLEEDTRYYVAIGVEYEDDDGDETLILGSVRSFTTD
jgi:hypothetical protein